MDEVLHLVFAVRRSLLLLSALIGSAFTSDCIYSNASQHPERALTAKQRKAIIRRAQVWTPTDVAAMDIRVGPRQKGAFAPGETITCQYVKEVHGGNTPKFGCALTPEDHLKVRFGRDNGEVYASVAATRLLWALGFGADAVYPVHVICRGCPPELGAQGVVESGQIRFDLAAVERKMPGREFEAPSVG